MSWRCSASISCYSPTIRLESTSEKLVMAFRGIRTSWI